MKRLIILIICVLITGNRVIHAQQSPLDAMLRMRSSQITDWRWVKQPWTSDSEPYLRVNRRINATFVNKNRIEAVTQKYRAAAEEHPTDPLAVYAWGYAAYAGRPLGAPINERELPKLAVALSLPSFPNTYEYARLRFVVTARWGPYSQLTPLGYRLLKRDPNDHDVKLGMLNILVAGTKAEQQQSLRYAQQLVNAYPKLPSSYSALGWVYEIQFALHKDATMGNKAIAVYRKAIALSKSPTGRQNVERNISRIRQEQAQLQKKK